MSTAATLSVDFVGKTAGIENAADKAANKVKKTADSIKKAGKDVGGLEGGLGNIAKQFEPIEKLGKVFAAMQAAATGFKAISAGIKGDWDGVGQALTELPFGIGSIAKTAQDLKAELTGARQELDKMNELAKNNEKENKFKENANKVYTNLRSQFAGSLQSEIRQQQLGNGDDKSKLKMQLEFDVQDIRSKLDESLKELNKNGFGKDSQQAKNLVKLANESITYRTQRYIQENEKLVRDEASKRKEALDKEVKERKDAEKKVADAALEARKKMAEDIGKLNEQYDPLLAFKNGKANLDKLMGSGMLSKKAYKGEFERLVKEFEEASSNKSKGGSSAMLTGYVDAAFYRSESNTSLQNSVAKIVSLLQTQQRTQGVGRYGNALQTQGVPANTAALNGYN